MTNVIDPGNALGPLSRFPPLPYDPAMRLIPRAGDSMIGPCTVVASRPSPSSLPWRSSGCHSMQWRRSCRSSKATRASPPRLKQPAMPQWRNVAAATNTVTATAVACRVARPRQTARPSPAWRSTLSAADSQHPPPSLRRHIETSFLPASSPTFSALPAADHVCRPRSAPDHYPFDAKASAHARAPRGTRLMPSRPVPSG